MTWVGRTQRSFRSCAVSENNDWAVALNIFDVRRGVLRLGDGEKRRNQVLTRVLTMNYAEIAEIAEWEERKAHFFCGGKSSGVTEVGGSEAGRY